jgi:hypothetical protein
MAATIHPIRARKPNRRPGALAPVPLPAPGTPERAALIQARVDRAVAERQRPASEPTWTA